MTPRSLVTGGAGFLGSHLCDRLIQEGHEVICLDNLLTGRIENLRHLMDHSRFLFVAHDVTVPIDLDKILEGARAKPGWGNGSGHRLDFVLHLASPASPKDYQRYPIHTLKVGGVGTLNALGLAKRYGSVFLLASTSEVYGDPEVHPQAESYWGRVNPIGPRSCYDEAKRYAEALTMGYTREHNIKVRIARIFNTYGERMRPDDGRVLPNFLLQALRNDPLTVYGDGKQTRSFCYVSDLIDGLFRLLLSEARGPVNLGNPEEMGLLDFARLIIRETRSQSKIVFEPLPEDDPQMRRPDLLRAETLLGWRPRVPLKEGVRRTIPYFREFLARPATATSRPVIPRQVPASVAQIDS
ncbi:MAG: UDP-glucuronic acid decarboxylase family protein [Terriglobia bacterium]